MQWIPMLKSPGTEHRTLSQYFVWFADFPSANADFDLFDIERDNDRRSNGIADASDYIVDIREFDVPYHVRVAIDKGWSSVRSTTLVQC